MKTRRICIVGNLLGRNAGYVTTQGQIIADLFAADGHEVTSASSRVDRVHRWLEIVKTVVQSRRVADIVIVEVYSGMSFLLADTVSLMTKYFRMPTIFVLHGGGLPVFISKFPHWAMRVLKRADLIVTPSAFLGNEIARYNIHHRIVPNVLDLDAYSYRLRTQIKPKLLWMRSFHNIYNPEMALRVLDLVRGHRPDASMVMAGVDKGLESRIKEMAAEMGLADSVGFPGFLDMQGKVREFSEADIYLNTNRIDNMPVSVVEACAMGVPVVATRVGGLSDLIMDGHDGLLVPDDDAEAMASAVIRLLDGPDLTTRISQNGRLLAERSSWDSVKKEWDSVFNDVLGTAERPTREQVSAEGRTI